MRHPFFEMPSPTVLGHRGAGGSAPENTLPSFERALADGADALESDVHLTRDGVPVLLHDPDVARTTEGTGTVADLSLAEIQRLDAGHRYSTDEGKSFPFRGRGLRVPTLDEAFSELRDAHFNLELKVDSAALCDAVLELVARHDRADRTLLTAGEDPAMATLRRCLAKSRLAAERRPALGACQADVLEFIRSATEARAPETDSMALQIPAEFSGRPLVTPELVAHARRHCIAVHVWTINDAFEMERLLDLGVDGLVTDFPGRLRALIDRRAAARN